VGPPWLGASLPGWAVLAAACPVFFGSLLPFNTPVAGSNINKEPAALSLVRDAAFSLSRSHGSAVAGFKCLEFLYRRESMSSLGSHSSFSIACLLNRRIPQQNTKSLPSYYWPLA